MYLLQRAAGQGQHVELVGHNRRIRQHQLHRLPVGLGQVDGHGPHALPRRMALQHPLHVHLPLPRSYRHRLPALQVPHPRPHTTRPPHAEAVQPQKDVRLGGGGERAVRLHPPPPPPPPPPTPPP